MKNILVLTDFSKNAEEAAELGATLSSKLNTNLLLFNTCATNAMVPFVAEPWMMDEVIWGDDDSRDNLNRLASQLKQFVGQLNAKAYKPLIYCDNGEGKLGAIVPEIICRKNIELIIMGARKDDQNEDDLFGSDLNSVIQISSRPILVVESKINLNLLNKVIFATNFDKSDMLAIHYLVKLGELLNFELEIVHINHPDKTAASSGQEIILIEQVTSLNYPKVTYHEIKGNNIVENIMRIYKDSGAGLLAMVHHQHSFIMRLLHRSTTKMMLNNQQIPLMIFPSKMK